VSSLYIISKLRNEHLSDEEIKKQEEKQKRMKEKLKSSSSSGNLKKSKSKNSATDLDSLNQTKTNAATDATDLDDVDLDHGTGAGDYDDFFIEHRPSLPPPAKTEITWNEYICSEQNNWPTLGRRIRSKESKKEFKAQLAMVGPSRLFVLAFLII
jgi:hypothetical protein